MAATLKNLAALFPEARIVGDAQYEVTGAKPLEQAGPGDLAFVADKQNLRKLSSAKVGAVVISEPLLAALDPGAQPAGMIVAAEPKAAFLTILDALYPVPARQVTGVSPNAFVGENASIGAETNIFPCAFVGQNVQIGERCDIHPGVYIGDGCRLGDDVVLYPNAVLYPGVSIGNNVIVHASAVLGADGFGYQLVEGRHRKIRHVGSVRIEDDVEIGASTTIDRAMVGETVIGRGTKLDNLIMIGHNCRIGAHNIFVSQVGLAGSVTTGDYVVFAGQVGIADHVNIGERCVLGSKAGLNRDMPPGETWIGQPAQPAAEAMRAASALKKLPELRKQFRELENQVAEISSRLETLSPTGPNATDVAA